MCLNDSITAKTVKSFFTLCKESPHVAASRRRVAVVNGQHSEHRDEGSGEVLPGVVHHAGDGAVAQQQPALTVFTRR